MKRILDYPIFCFDRNLRLIVRKKNYKVIYDFLDCYYEKWMEDDEADEIFSTCLEEYMVSQLRQNTFSFRYVEGDESSLKFRLMTFFHIVTFV